MKIRFEVEMNLSRYFRGLQEIPGPLESYVFEIWLERAVELINEELTAQWIGVRAHGLPEHRRIILRDITSTHTYPCGATGDQLLIEYGATPEVEDELVGRTKTAFQRAYHRFEAELQEGERV